MPTAQIAFKLAALLYLVVIPLPFLTSNRKILICGLLPGVCFNAMAIFLRYELAWPMVPMYISPVMFPFFLGLLSMCVALNKKDDQSLTALKVCLVLLGIFSLSAVLFPKDFYMPYWKFNSLFAHAFMAMGALGKGFFIVSSAYAVAALVKHRGNQRAELYGADIAGSFFWGATGYAVWTVSMFCGEMWSYLGWGTPVVWDDAAILTTMATWFFYTCFLHLHLTGTWSVRARAWYAAAGAPMIYIFNAIPDFGPYRALF